MENLDHINQKDEEMRRILHEPLHGEDAWAQPSDRVWEGIEASLPEKRRRGGFWWWMGGAALLVLVVLLMADGLNKSSSPQRHGPSMSDTPASTTEKREAIHPDGLSDANQLVPVPSSSRTRPDGRDPLPASIQDDASMKHPDSDIPLLITDPPIPSSPETEAIPEPIGGSALPVRTGIPDEEPRAGIPVPDHGRYHTPVPGLARPLEELEYAHEPRLPIWESPVLSSSFLLPPSERFTGSEHRLMIYGQGFGADRQIRRKVKNNFFDPEFGHTNSQVRVGAGYEWQHRSGFFLGTGVEYQDFSEEVVKEKSWTFTKQNSTQVGAQRFEQFIPLVINSGFGTASATLRVDIDESNPTAGYQEGDQVAFRMTVDHSLKWMRVPVVVGYHYAWKNWFAEVRGGMGLQIFLSSNARITQVMDDRGIISLQETQRTNSIKHVRSTIWDTQAGLYAGYRWSDHWSASCGYERWYSLQSVVNRPNFTTLTNGSGIQLALRYTF